MKKWILLLIALSPVATIFAANGEIPEPIYPTLVQTAATTAEFIPKGWILETSKEGDLNGDHAPDVAFIARQQDPKNILKNDGLGEPELNTNPRILAVAFYDSQSKRYQLQLSDHDLIPRHDDPIRSDPFSGISIARGTLRIEIEFWSSAGSWTSTSSKLTFRYQDECFRLIGLDDLNFKRNSGEQVDTSINYSTGKVRLTRSDNGKNQRDVWKSIDKQKQSCLTEIGNAQDFVDSQVISFENEFQDEK